jgi:hypothetical protein
MNCFTSIFRFTSSAPSVLSFAVVADDKRIAGWLAASLAFAGVGGPGDL